MTHTNVNKSLHLYIAEYLLSLDGQKSASVPRDEIFNILGITDKEFEAFKRNTQQNQSANENASLEDIFVAGCKSLKILDAVQASAEHGSVKSDDKSVENSEHFQKFLANVVSRGFFGEHQPGSDEYNSRYQKVIEKYNSRFATSQSSTESDSKKASLHSSLPSKSSKTPNDVSADSSTVHIERSVKAEVHKNQGNKYLQAKEYLSAISEYSKAIDLAPTGPSSHIYYSNRAAAYLHLHENLISKSNLESNVEKNEATNENDVEILENAVNDCNMAIALDSTYTKAHTRLAQAYLAMGNPELAKQSAQSALSLESGNPTASQLLALANNRIKLMKGDEEETSVGNGGFSMPDLSGLGGGLGGMDFGAMMNNPMVQQMAQNLANNPDMMNSLSGMLGGMGGAGGAGPGGMDFAKMAAEMGKNPEMMANLSKMMGGLGGMGGFGGGSKK